MGTLQHFGALFFCAAVALVACSVPDVVFAPDPDAGDSGDDASPPEASPTESSPTQDAGTPVPEAPPMPPGGDMGDGPKHKKG